MATRSAESFAQIGGDDEKSKDEEHSSEPLQALEVGLDDRFQKYGEALLTKVRNTLQPGRVVEGYCRAGQLMTPLTFDYKTFEDYEKQARDRFNSVFDDGDPYEQMVLERANNVLINCRQIWIDEKNGDPFVLIAPCPLMLWQYLAICADYLGLPTGAEKIIAAQHTYESLAFVPF